MTAFFVTATGTDVGKTFITAGLIRAMRASGREAIGLKPVVTGFTVETAAESDPVQLLAAMGEKLSMDSVGRVSPWRFCAPMSPDMAAAREKRSIDFEELVAFCNERALWQSGVLLIEGVGGVMVPLDARHTVLDWMKALGLPVLLVAGSYLGTISHTLTALDVLTHAGLSVNALVINESGDSAVSIEDTCATLRRFVGSKSILSIPRVKSWTDAREALDRLAHLLEHT